MQAHYEIDQDGVMLRVELTGRPNLRETRSLAAAIGEVHGFEPGMCVLIDGRGLAALPNADDVQQLAYAYRALRETGVVGPTAIVLESETGYAVARSFQCACGGGTPQVATFRDPDFALTWLEHARTQQLAPASDRSVLGGGITWVAVHPALAAVS